MKIAIILNYNARNIRTSMINNISEMLTGNEKIFITRSLKELQNVVKYLANNKYDVVFCGGGDGTFASCVTEFYKYNQHIPTFGILKFGTGNALADVVGVSGDVRKELDQAYSLDKISIPMIKSENMIAPFAGIGIDASVLEDYNKVKSFLDKIPFSNLVDRGLIDYSVAILSKTIWKLMFKKMPQIKISSRGKAYRIDFQGRPTNFLSLGKGDVLYEGPISLAAASTTQFYGMGMKIFPQANVNTRAFQLRVSSMDIPTMIANFPMLFFGNGSSPLIWDYACEKITIESSTAVPFQIGGDLIGKRKKVDIDICQVDVIRGSVAAAPEPNGATNATV